MGTNDINELYVADTKNGVWAAVHLAGLRKHCIESGKEAEIVPHLLRFLSDSQPTKITHKATGEVVWEKI
jgi:hypothetical protein